MEKKISKSRQFSFQSHPELIGPIEQSVSRLGMRREYLGRKLGVGHAYNALLLWYSRLSEEAQDSLMNDSLDVLQDFELGKPIPPLTAPTFHGAQAANLKSTSRKGVAKGE